MSVGLYDADQATFTKVVFNLELMKLSAYYKRKGEIVILAPEFAPEKHSKFIYRKDYDDGIYPKNLVHPNVEYGGLAFSNNIYLPLPLEIERMRPDTEIYRRTEQDYLLFSKDKDYNHSLFYGLMNGEHLRLSLDGKTLWDGYESQIKNIKKTHNIILHDYNLGAIDGSFEVIKDLSSMTENKRTPKIGMKFPVQVQDEKSFLKWMSLNKSPLMFSLRYNGVLSNEAVMEWIRLHCKLPTSAKLEYNVTPPWYDQNDFVMNLLPQIFRQVIILWSYNVDFSLKYDEDFFTDKRWIEVIELILYFIRRLKGHKMNKTWATKIPGDETLFSEMKFLSKLPQNENTFVELDLQKAREIFAFVRENNYQLFQDFYECSINSLGGTL